jgi:hypothetical protein
VTELLLTSDQFFAQPPECIATRVGLAALALAVIAWLISGRRLQVAAVAAIFVLACAYGYYRVFRFVVARLGHNLPTVTLLAPLAGDRVGPVLSLLAHATDTPGAFGPVPAVRMIEFWLYHPSFAEQHPGNLESKVFLGQVPGPTADDQYAASWTCVNPYTPPRDGDHSGGDGTREYKLPKDSRPYSIQAHGLDDEWIAKPGRPGKSERAIVAFEPCD